MDHDGVGMMLAWILLGGEPVLFFWMQLTRSQRSQLMACAPLRLANEAGGQCTAAAALVDRCLDQVYNGVRGVADGLLALAWLG